MKFEMFFAFSMFLLGVGGFFLASSVLTMTGLSIAEVDGGGSSSSLLLFIGIGVIIAGIFGVMIAKKFYKHDGVDKKSIKGKKVGGKGGRKDNKVDKKKDEKKDEKKKKLKDKKKDDVNSGKKDKK